MTARVIRPESRVGGPPPPTRARIRGLGHWLNNQERVHFGLGLTNGKFLYNNNLSTGIGIIFEYDIYQRKDFSISLGTHFKFGGENKNGLGILQLVEIFGGPGSSPENGPNFVTYTDVPLTAHFNFFAGSQKGDEETPHHTYGFYVGGGITGLTTGFTNPKGDAQSVSYFGYVLDAGVRVFKWLDIGVSRIASLQGSVGNMANPVFYSLSVSFRK